MSRLSLSLTITVALAIAFGFAGSAYSDPPKTKRLLLIGQGPDGHPPATHEYMAGARILEKMLAHVQGLQTTVVKADEPWPDGPALIDQTDSVVMFVTQGARWMQLDPKRHAALRRLAQRKGGIVALHWAVGATNAQYIDGQLELLGGTRGGPQRKYQVLETDVKIADRKHPIATGLNGFRVRDEFYYRLDFVKPPNHVQPLLTARIDDKDETVCWTWARPDGGRSFGFVGLHFHSNWQRPEYRRLVLQGILWTLEFPIPQEGMKVDIEPKALELD